MSEITRNPLCWPDNVVRTPPHRRERARFGNWSVFTAVNLVTQEVNRLNGHPWNYRDERLVVSSNLSLKANGDPYSSQKEPSDTGAAVYFQLQFTRNAKRFERPIVLTCDKWNRVAWNLYAIAKDIEAQRARSRWGCTNLEQSFRGYIAIPEKCGAPSWWVLLDVLPTAGREEIKTAFRRLAQTAHPDKGGKPEQWSRLQEAYEQAMAQSK